MAHKVLAHPSFFSWQKRLIDLTLSSLGLLILTPIYFLTWPILLLLHGRPIIFKQKRIGQNGQVFTIYKLRTMVKNAEMWRGREKKRFAQLNYAPAPMFKIANDPRFTKIGHWLSRTGLDELPQLINIFKGEMSFVGPRPLPKKEALALKTLKPVWFEWRHRVKPGIFSVWTLDDRRHQSLKVWQTLDQQTLALSLLKQFQLMIKIALKQIKKF